MSGKRRNNRIPSEKQLAALKPIQPGEVRNPWGFWGKQGDIKKELMKLTNDALVDILKAAMASDSEALKEMIKDPKTAVLKKGIAKALLDAAESGNWTRLNEILERIIGKVPNKLELTKGNPFEGKSEEELAQEYEKQKKLLGE